MRPMAKIDDILADFEYLEEWEDRYRYVIELGKALPDLPDSDKTAEHKVRGCASQVWLISDIGQGNDPVMNFRGDSDAHIVRGLVAIVLAIYSGRRASEIAKLDEVRKKAVADAGENGDRRLQAEIEFLRSKRELELTASADIDKIRDEAAKKESDRLKKLRDEQIANLNQVGGYVTQGLSLVAEAHDEAYAAAADGVPEGAGGEHSLLIHAKAGTSILVQPAPSHAEVSAFAGMPRGWESTRKTAPQGASTYQCRAAVLTGASHSAVTSSSSRVSVMEQPAMSSEVT